MIDMPPPDHPEFSEEGRDPRFPPGWWAVAALIVTVGLAAWWLT